MSSVSITSLARKDGASGACKASALNLNPAVSQDDRAGAFFKPPADASPQRVRHRRRLPLAAGVVIVRIALSMIYALAFVWAALFLLSLTG